MKFLYFIRWAVKHAKKQIECLPLDDHFFQISFRKNFSVHFTTMATPPPKQFRGSAKIFSGWATTSFFSEKTRKSESLANSLTYSLSSGSCKGRYSHLRTKIFRGQLWDSCIFSASAEFVPTRAKVFPWQLLFSRFQTFTNL